MNTVDTDRVRIVSDGDPRSTAVTVGGRPVPGVVSVRFAAGVDDERPRAVVEVTGAEVLADLLPERVRWVWEDDPDRIDLDPRDRAALVSVLTQAIDAGPDLGLVASFVTQLRELVARLEDHPGYDGIPF